MNINNIAHPSRSRLSVEDVPARIQSPVARSLRRLAQSASLCAAVLLFSGLGISSAKAETGTLTGLAADAEARSDGNVTNVSVSPLLIGGISGAQICLVNMFQIPSSILRDPAQQFSAATYSVRTGYMGSLPMNGDLYGIGYDTTSSAVAASDYYEGTLDEANTLIHDNFITGAIPSWTLVSSTNASLVNYLNAQLNAARADGADTAYVFFRINPDAYTYWNGYQIGTTEGGSSYTPTLAYTTASVPIWSAVPLGGGGYVTGLVSDPTGADIYCRTDVGGVFKWDAPNVKWNSITDMIVSSTNTNACTLTGISSIALDPNNFNKLYIGVGDLWHTALYASSDKGANWTQISTTVAMNDNGGFRATGERLAVDPNNSNILWYGSSAIGLQKGVFSSGTWSWTQVPSTSVPFGAVASGDKAGVTFVACDRNGGSTIVYAGVYDSVGSTGGIYMTMDGTNWSKVSGVSFGTPARGQVSPNGTLYATKYGTVGKLLRGGTLSAITPVASVGYRGLAIDPNDATGNTLYVSDNATRRIWRSVTGGTGTTPWALQDANFNNNVSFRTEPDGTPCVTGYWFGNVASLMVNPANSNELWVGDFFGVARTQDAQNLGTNPGSTWYMLQKNQEETCPEALLNAPTGAKLMVGQGDVGGYRYLDTSVRPSGTGGSSFSNPSGGSNPGLDFCESNNNIWARTWLNPAQSGGSGATSSDGGATWVKFGEITEKTVTNSVTPGWETWDVGTYLAKQKAKGVNTVTLVLCCGNSISPLYASNAVYFDSKEATDSSVWPKLVINGTSNLNPIADTYVADSGTGTNYGTATSLAVTYKFYTAPDTRWIYLKFDLSSLGAITSGTLQLNRKSATNTVKYPIGVYACANTNWDEATITWANRPKTLASSGIGQYDTGDVIANPRYYDGSTLLNGGRIAISATNPDIMVWLPQTIIGPRYSNDRGTSWTSGTGAPTSQMWTRDNPTPSLNQLAADRVNGKFYIAKFGVSSTGGDVVYTSTNGGANWVITGTCPTGTYNIYHSQIVAAPASANDIWICDDGANSTAAGGVWRSTDGGVNWLKKSSGVISGVRLISFGKAQSGNGYTVFVKGYKNGIQGIYRSDDYGVTWNALAVLPTGCLIHALAGDRQNYGKVFFGTNGRGVYQGQ